MERPSINIPMFNMLTVPKPPVYCDSLALLSPLSSCSQLSQRSQFSASFGLHVESCDIFALRPSVFQLHHGSSFYCDLFHYGWPFFQSVLDDPSCSFHSVTALPWQGPRQSQSSVLMPLLNGPCTTDGTSGSSQLSG